jgi:hypothetical protein
MGGRLALESVAGFVWNTQTDHASAGVQLQPISEIEKRGLPLF